MTFPLPLVPFENYMLADNTARYPRVFVIEARLSGNMDRAALESAWRAALARHPLLGARVSTTWRGSQWVAGDGSPPVVDWAAEDVPMTHERGEFIDLARESGVRLWARVGPDAARLVLQFHHACCDGVGGLLFLGELLAEYARRTSPEGTIADLPQLDPTLLAGRGGFGLTPPSFREWLGHAWMTLRESWRLVARRAISVEPPANQSEARTPAPFPGLEAYHFDEQESQRLREAAKAAGVTLNDLLMCYLFRAIVQWNAAHASRARGGWLRINVPTNLRRPEDLRMPAANVMSFTFLDRRPRDRHDGPALLQSIRAEMEVIKRRRLGLYFIAQLALVGRIPGGMRLIVGRARCFATAVLTNLGDAGKIFQVEFPRRGDKLVIGNMQLESLVGTPPLRPLTHVGVAVATYARRLAVCVLCDRHHFTRDETIQFLDLYLAEIRKGLTPRA